MFFHDFVAVFQQNGPPPVTRKCPRDSGVGGINEAGRNQVSDLLGDVFRFFTALKQKVKRIFGECFDESLKACGDENDRGLIDLDDLVAVSADQFWNPKQFADILKIRIKQM